MEVSNLQANFFCWEVFWLAKVEEQCDGNDNPLAKACCIMIGTEHQCKNCLDNCFSWRIYSSRAQPIHLSLSPLITLYSNLFGIFSSFCVLYLFLFVMFKPQHHFLKEGLYRGNNIVKGPGAGSCHHYSTCNAAWLLVRCFTATNCTKSFGKWWRQSNKGDSYGITLKLERTVSLKTLAHLVSFPNSLRTCISVAVQSLLKLPSGLPVWVVGLRSSLHQIRHTVLFQTRSEISFWKDTTNCNWIMPS